MEKNSLLFECSWEVCNKVGGIYTVLMSKADKMKEFYGNNYFTIGPFFPRKKLATFEETEVPDFLDSVFNNLEKKGIICHFGKWLVKGEPNAILIDFKSLIGEKNNIKRELWDDFKIDSLNSGWDFEESIIWSWAVGMFLEEVANSGKKLIGHFHEWLAGGAILYLKKNGLDIPSVFTTHATMLGRAISGSGRDLYSELDKLDPEKEAYNSGVEAKFFTEKACAHNCSVFTTVSEITAIEAEKILDKKPKILLPNGLDMTKFPSFEDRAVMHMFAKQRIKDFLAFYFFPYQNFDLDNTLIFYTFGRYEFRNKGLDVLIKSLGKLNENLKKKKSKQTIVCFFWIPTGTLSIKKEVLENKSLFDDMKLNVEHYMNEVKTKILNAIVNKQDLKKINLFNKDFLLEVKKEVISFSKEGNPLLCTHNLSEENDMMLNLCREVGLDNQQDDKVKIVFHPAYLTGTDGLLDLSYYDAMIGGQLGIYPSYYEPWGYTPLESAALGVPAVTTDLAGFGRWIAKQTDQTKKPAIYVLDRFSKNDEDSSSQLSDFLYYYARLSRPNRLKKKLEAKKLADLADWKKLVKNYFKAHQKASEVAKNA